MFIHNFKYSLKTLFRNRMLIFWTFAFPIIMAVFFNLAFSNIVNSEKFDVIDIAIVNNEDFENNEAYKMVFKELGDESSENHMFNIKYVNEEEATDLLKNDKIVGYMKLEGDNPKVTFTKNGTNQTIFKYVVEEIAQKSNMINNIVEKEMTDAMMAGNADIDVNAIAQKAYMMSAQSDVKLKNTSNKNLNYMMIEFYTLIAMTCLYGGAFGMVAVNQNLANMTNQGKRISVSPIQKTKMILGSVCAGYLAQLLGLALLFAFTILSPYLYKKELVDIFGEDLFEKESLLEIFKELTGNSDHKPFDCVGTFEEVNFAVTKTIENLEEKGEKLPYLLQYYKDDCKMSDTSDDITKRYNENNNLTDEQNKLLKAKLFE